MGKLFEREYYRITEAASELGCAVDDLIHWAAIGRISLGVLFTIDGFARERYFYNEDFEKWDPNELVAEFTGFVYVDKGYFQDMELRDGELQFNCVVRMDGRAIGKKPIGDNFGVEARSLEQIYFHSNDLRKLLSLSAPAVTDKPLTTKERRTLLTIIAALCDYSAIKHQERGAASQIAKLTEAIGAPVTDDTVRTVLARVSDALEARMK